MGFLPSPGHRTVSLVVMFLAGVTGAGVGSAQTPAPTSAIILRHATLLDGRQPGPQRDVTITLRNGRIESVRPDHGPRTAADSVIDLRGAWVIPGFIDAHVHIGLNPMSREPDSVAAQRALDGGVTTVRSLGTLLIPGYRDVALRESYLTGTSRLPRILVSGPWIVPIVSDDWLRDFPTLRSALTPATPADSALMLAPGPGWRLTGNVAAIDSAVGVLKAHGADWVKLFATGRAGGLNPNPETLYLTESDMRAAIVAARRRGLEVATHAHGDQGIRAAVLAGTRTIEHGTYASDETLRLMSERGTCFVPTLSSWDLALPTTDSATLARNRAMRTIAEAAVRRARGFGVRIIAGGDNAYLRLSPRYSAELLALARAGLSPDEVIRAATAESARCLGLDNRLGSVVPGLEADLLVIDQDPRDDLTRADRPRMVFVAGRLVVDRRQ